VKLALDTLLPEGFSPVIPPVMIRPEAYMRMGRLAGAQKEERYYLPGDDLYLVGSSEHTIGPMHMDETLEEALLPRRYVGFSTCFRREAGSYGKDTKGILRVHQFDKIELFSFTKPEDSEEEHKFLLSLQEKLMQKLGLHCRVMAICTGDMGWTDARQFDIEFMHMLNATGFAIGRMLIAIIENYQTKDGHIRVPDALQGYVGKEII
jgi:seryl-tRNA synthetase